MQKVVLQPFDSSLAEAAGVTLRFEYSDKKMSKRDKTIAGNVFCRIFAMSDCRQRARTICFCSNIQAGPF